MKRYIKLSILTLSTVCLVFLTGCWDSKELDSMSMVIGLGIDHEENDDINVTLQLNKITPTEGKSSNSSDDSYVIVSQSSQSIRNSLDRIRLKNPRSIFLQQNQIIIIGKEQAEEGIVNHLDYLIRESVTRMDVKMVVADKKAKDILSVSPEQEKNSSEAIIKLLRDLSSLSEKASINLLDFANSSLQVTNSQVVPIIKYRELENKKSEIYTEDMAVFKDGKMVGTLKKEQVLGFFYTLGASKDNTIQVQHEDGTAELRVTELDGRISPKIQNNNSVKIDGKYHFELVISELKGFENKTVSEINKILEDGAKISAEKYMRDTFEYSKSISADIYGIGEKLYRQDSKRWEKIKDNWDEIYKQSEFSPEISIQIIDSGKIVKSLEKGIFENE